MIDADLNNNWGDSRHVTYSKDGSDITINLWDENLTADDLKSVNNWDEFKQNKIDNFCNLYIDVLARFHMDNTALILNITDAAEENVFLTIEDGEVTFDYFAQ